MSAEFTKKTKDLIDGLKGTCANFGLGNDGNESKIITQVFLYKFMNDKFGYELQKIDPRFATATSWEKEVSSMEEDEFLKVSKNLVQVQRSYRKTNSSPIYSTNKIHPILRNYLTAR